MFIDTLREERVQDPAERRRCLTVINQELTRLDGLVGKLIELSKIESSHAVFDRRPLLVSHIVDDALASFEAIRFSENVDLQVKIDAGLVVHGDRAALAQAVGNLLGNAWKYTRPQDKKIEVSATADAKHVYITVTDNGVGIPRGEQSAIFEKFQRGSAGLDGGSPGSGLGLALVRAVVEAHHGKVDVRSESDRGARLRIVLPRSSEGP